MAGHWSRLATAPLMLLVITTGSAKLIAQVLRGRGSRVLGGGGEIRCVAASTVMRSEFRDLAAYQRATELADGLWRQVARWDSLERWSIGMQLVRAVDSIGANIAEATGRWHPKDELRFLRVARGSLLETEHWITTAERRGLLPEGTSDRLDAIARPLSGLINKRVPS